MMKYESRVAFCDKIAYRCHVEDDNSFVIEHN